MENVGNQLSSWHQQCAIFLLKKSSNLAHISSLSAHRRVINSGNSSCGFCLYIFAVTNDRLLHTREQLFSPFSFFPLLILSPVKNSSRTYALIERCWYRQQVNEDARVYIFTLDKYCDHDQSLFGLLCNG